ncbi:MAG TPA: TA system VapC family ribonuclease toxin [Burkholderiaceae bacterium]|jgi:toxin-antitoxin system PIN domain toxin|nr:TA system VapC family ribonuclease toxin [Burkholderiaceae bacterium]
MSFAVDVNILLYASDASSPWHERAADFVARCARGPQVFCLAWVTVMNYLRIATHARVFAAPLTHAEAVANVEALLALPHCRALGEGEGFWRAYREVSAEVPTRVNLVPDSHLAAVLREHGVGTLYTNDRDFRKYSFLDVRDPLQ